MSTALFDTVAVYLAAEQDLVEMRYPPLVVTDEGYTVIDATDGRMVSCAVAWTDLEAFRDRRVDTLLG